MRRVRFAALLFLLAFALKDPRVPVSTASVAPDVAIHSQAFLTPPGSPPTHDIPGGGSILYLPGSGIGVVDAVGMRSTFGRWRAADAFWDPLHPGHILVNAFTNRSPRLREYRRNGDGWDGVGTWPDGYGEYSQVSLDGTWFAYNVMAKGRITWTIQVAGRDGTVRTMYRRNSYPTGWTPDGRVVVSDWRESSSLLLWDPFKDVLERAPLGDLLSKLPSEAVRPELDPSRMTWSSDGRFFAAPVYWREHHHVRNGIAVGTLAEGVLHVVPTRHGQSAATWSPVRSEIAFVSAVKYRDPAKALHVYDVTTEQDSIVRRGVPDRYWVAWSPAGDWMLLDDAEQIRWLFVSRDGSQVVNYPWLGSYPRWAERSITLHIVVC